MIDLDHFKDINDEYGHEVGDRVLVDFARFILDRIRLQDLFGRIGGEEFLLFMPECTSDQAKTRLASLIDELKERRAIPEIKDLRYSFSCGLIRLTPDTALDEGMDAADQLLYLAKDAGRACILTTPTRR
jgi:diguanylate cyclase (GGDEF)-like protein